MKVRLLRACCFGGKRKEPGAEIEIADVKLAREMIWLGKAEAVAVAPPPSGPLTTESVAELVPGKPRKEKKDVV